MRILDEPNYTSKWLSRSIRRAGVGDSDLRPFTFTGTAIYLFVSGAPCGDASLDLLANHSENAIPWKPLEDGTNILHGHEYLWERGKLRLKPGNSVGHIQTNDVPGRADSPRTLSNSCSDKLTLKSCTSLLNSLLASIIDPSSCYI